MKKKTGSGKRTSGKNISGAKNSLVDNINARKKKGISRSKKNSTISSNSYKHMQNNWEKVK